MAPSRKGKGKAPATSEGESSAQRNIRGRNAYISPPPYPIDRPVLMISRHRTFDAGHPERTKQVPKVILQEVRQHYPGPYTRYTDFPDNNKTVIKKHYKFADRVVESDAWTTFRRIADKRLQDMLNKAKDAAVLSYGDSMLEWKEHSMSVPQDDEDDDDGHQSDVGGDGIA